MKKFFLFPLMVLATLIALPACSDDDKETIDPGKPETPVATTYTGRLTVNNGAYIKENADCEITFAENGNKLTLNINNVKFAEAMPVTINFSVPEIPCVTENGKTIFSGNDIVPLMGVAPAEAYKFSAITGSIENSALEFSATLTKGSFSFTGVEKQQ